MNIQNACAVLHSLRGAVWLVDLGGKHIFECAAKATGLNMEKIQKSFGVLRGSSFFHLQLRLREILHQIARTLYRCDRLSM